MSDDGIHRTMMPDASEDDALPASELRAVRGWLNGKPTFTPPAERADVAGDEVAMLRAEIAALHRNQIEMLEMVHELITKDVPGWIDTKCERVEHRLRLRIAEQQSEILGKLNEMLINAEGRAMGKLRERAFKFAGESGDDHNSDVLPNWRKPDVSKVN